MTVLLPKELKLPAMPQVARECLLYLYNPNIDAALLSKALSRDIGISANIFKLANSSQFVLGRGPPTSDLKKAIIRIGSENLRQLMLLYAMENTVMFKGSAFFSYKSFSRHSLFVSLLCTGFAHKISPDSVADVQLAGLMHDVGLALMNIFCLDLFLKMEQHCLEKQVDFVKAEENFDLESHAALGAMALNEWEIPEKVKHIVSLHDTKNIELRKNLPQETNRLLDILMLSDLLAHSFGFGFAHYKRDTRVELSLLKKMELTTDDVKEVVKNALEMESALQGS
jgi:HD-like signal output (HDOD) protein